MAAVQREVCRRVDAQSRRSLVTQPEDEKPSHGELELGCSINGELGHKTNSRELQKSNAGMAFLDGAPTMHWKDSCQKPLVHQSEFEPLTQSDPLADSNLYQLPPVTDHETAPRIPSSLLSQPASLAGHEAALGTVSPNKATSPVQHDLQEINCLKDDCDKEKGRSTSTSKNKAEERFLERGVHHKKFLLFFRRKKSNGCNEAGVKQSNNEICVVSEANVSVPPQVEKPVLEGEHCSKDTRSAISKESGKKRNGPCFALKLLSCLKTPQKKSRGSAQVKEVELVQECKGTIRTGWRQEASDVRNKKLEGNHEMQSLRKPVLWCKSTHQKQRITAAAIQGEGLHNMQEEADYQCSPLQKRRNPDNLQGSLITSTTGTGKVEMTVPASTKQGAACAESALKSRKHLKMKPWRTVPYLGRSKPQIGQSELRKEREAENQVLNVTTIPECCDEMEEGGETCRPYSKLSFFKKIRWYNRQRKITGGFIENVACESAYEDKHTFGDAVKEDITVADTGSVAMLSHKDISSTQAQGLLSTEQCLTDIETVGIPQETAIILMDTIVSYKDSSVSEERGPVVTQRGRSDAEMVIVIQDNLNTEVVDVSATAIAGLEVSWEDVNAADVANPKVSKGDLTDAGAMGSKQNTVVDGHMVSQEDVPLPQILGDLAFQGEVEAESLEGLIVTREDATAARSACRMATQEHLTAPQLPGSVDTLEFGTVAMTPDLSPVEEVGTVSKVEVQEVVTTVPFSMVSKEDVTATNRSAPTISWNSTKVEEAKDVKCSEQISAEKHFANGKRIQISPSQNFNTDSKLNIEETEQEKESELAYAPNLVSNASESVPSALQDSCAEPQRNDKLLAEASDLAMLRNAHNVKYPLVTNIYKDSGGQNEHKQLVKSDISGWGHTAEGDRHKAGQNNIDSSQKESVPEEADPCTPGVLSAGESAAFQGKTQDHPHLQVANLTQEVNVTSDQKVAISLAQYCEFYGHTTVRNWNERDVPLLLRPSPSSQETLAIRLSTLQLGSEEKECDALLSHNMASSSLKHVPKQRYSGGSSQQFQPALKKDMRVDTRQRCSLPNTDKEQTPTPRKSSTPSLRTYRSFETNQLEGDMFEGTSRGTTFSWSEGTEGIQPQENTKANLQPTSLLPNEMSDITTDPHEQEKKLLYEAAVEVVQAAIHAATGHIALWRQQDQEEGRGLQESSSPGAGDLPFCTAQQLLSEE
ncbi:uncharacterized protein [Ambystoma mexicanum]|uniref:uncharacterized protein n=1 Tax=Ambystoma mexicanum TaxID=8296 RepID=UPI0037E71A0C